MEQRFKVRGTENPYYRAVEIPCLRDHTRMLVVAPTQGTFQQFEKLLNPELLNQIRNGLQLRVTNLYLPKFKFEAELNLAPVLSDMEMPLAFNPGQTEFSIMDRSQRSHLTHTIHQA